MARIQMIALAGKSTSQAWNQCRTHGRHFDTLPPFGRQRAGRRAPLGVAHDIAKRAQCGVDIQIGAEIGRPVFHCHADSGQLPTAPPNAERTGTGLACSAQFVQGLDETSLESGEILAHGPAVIRQRNDRIDGQLPRRVDQRAATPIDPVHGRGKLVPTLVAPAPKNSAPADRCHHD